MNTEIHLCYGMFITLNKRKCYLILNDTSCVYKPYCPVATRRQATGTNPPNHQRCCITELTLA